ncbi:uncharacterized protein METZ01_LOCUS464726, partial [marine metagenome]
LVDTGAHRQKVDSHQLERRWPSGDAQGRRPARRQCVGDPRPHCRRGAGSRSGGQHSGRAHGGRDDRGAVRVASARRREGRFPFGQSRQPPHSTHRKI